MVLHSPMFDGHKIVLRDVTCSKYSIEAFCDDWKTLKQTDRKTSLPWSGQNMLGFGILLKYVVWMMYPVICNIGFAYKITVIVKLLISQFISDWCCWWKPSWCSKSCKIYFFNGAVKHCSGKTILIHRNTLWWKHSLGNLKKPLIMNKVLIMLKFFLSIMFFVILSSVWYDKTA